MDEPDWMERWTEARDVELASLRTADLLITVSDVERDFIVKTLQLETGQAFTVGHTMPLHDPAEFRTFEERRGILFVGAYHHAMYYNGDALGYFLEQIYPLVLETEPDIPLLIAGKSIPLELFDMVQNSTNALLRDRITFLESPVSVQKLYNKARLFIAPHLYGAGAQYKLGEAMSLGLPVVLSSDAALNLGLSNNDVKTACIGKDPATFARCVVKIHQNETTWNNYRAAGFQHIRDTHDRASIQSSLGNAIEAARGISHKRSELRKA